VGVEKVLLTAKYAKKAQSIQSQDIIIHPDSYRDFAIFALKLCVPIAIGICG